MGTQKGNESVTLLPSPIAIGPTWKRNADGGWVLPEKTLGWDVISWAAETLLQPDGPNSGQPWQWTPEQARLLLWWYAVDDYGRFTYRRGVLRRMKGWGKDPFAAALCLTEFMGPCRFGGWDSSGDPIAVPHPAPWVQVAAVNITQPLALDTPVPSPDGWTTVGELRVGDRVFGSDGAPTNVVETTPVLLGEDCYRVTFRDGEEIVASGSHGWTLQRLDGRGRTWETVTVTTEQMAADYLKGAKRQPRYRVGLVEQQYPERDLPLDPYLLGLWLGDGTKWDSTIAYDTRVKDEMEAILKPLLGSHERVTWGHFGGIRGLFVSGMIRVMRACHHRSARGFGRRACWATSTFLTSIGAPLLSSGGHSSRGWLTQMGALVGRAKCASRIWIRGFLRGWQTCLRRSASGGGSGTVASAYSSERIARRRGWRIRLSASWR